jgi:predicted RNase H-like HicB family nuclease
MIFRRLSMIMRFTAVFEQVPEGYIGFVEELPGANTQGATLEEARANLEEAVELVLEANRVLAEEATEGRPVIREPWVITSK